MMRRLLARAARRASLNREERPAAHPRGMRPAPLVPSPPTALDAVGRPPPATPATQTFQLYRGGTLLATLVDGCTDVDPGWAHHRMADPDAPRSIQVPPRWGDDGWFLTDCARVWDGIEVRRM